MKLSIITPVLNGEQFLGETIESVINQKGNFSIEYIIVDGQSKDGTLDVITYFQKLVVAKSWPRRCKSVSIKLLRGQDVSMYDAVNKGFAIATGDILAYINSDDIYLPGAFQNIVKVFRDFKHVRWLKGITSYIDESSTINTFGECYLYDQNLIQKGAYGRYTYFIQQDSVFWRRELWEKYGPIDTKYLLAGDFYLWSKFARHTALYSLAKYVSCFRVVKGQLSEHMRQYRSECDEIVPYNKLLHLKYTMYHHFQYRFPKFIARIASELLLGVQKFNKIIIHRNVIFIINQTYYA